MIIVSSKPWSKFVSPKMILFFIVQVTLLVSLPVVMNRMAGQNQGIL